MGGGVKRARSKGIKSPKKKEGPLEKSFKTRITQKTPAAAPKDGQVAQKMQTAGFLSYLHSSIKSSTGSLSNMACEIQKRYREMDAAGKRQMIVEFYRNGGKKSGLTSTYNQAVSTTQNSSDKGWAGYVTVGKMLELHGVPHTYLRESHPTETNILWIGLNYSVFFCLKSGER